MTIIHMTFGMFCSFQYVFSQIIHRVATERTFSAKILIVFATDTLMSTCQVPVQVLT